MKTGAVARGSKIYDSGRKSINWATGCNWERSCSSVCTLATFVFRGGADLWEVMADQIVACDK